MCRPPGCAGNRLNPVADATGRDVSPSGLGEVRSLATPATRRGPKSGDSGYEEGGLKMRGMILNTHSVN